MKSKYGYIGIVSIILIFGFWVVKECKSRRTIANTTLEHFEKIPNFSFINQHGDTITQKEVQGKVYIVEFFFTSCPNICPKMTNNTILLQNKFYSNPNFAILSISIDPERDTPKVLKQYAKEKGATLQSWYFLTGDRQQIYDFSNKGFHLYASENQEVEGGFEHSGLFALIDKKGYIRSRLVWQGENQIPIKYYDGLNLEQIDMLKVDIQKLLNE